MAAENAVSHYLGNILAPALRKYGTSPDFIEHTLDVIRTQMFSLLRHWNDFAFRSAVLLLGLEEGSFYEPPCKLDIRCFVVTTIRNSPIETLQSDACAEAGLRQPLLGRDVKAITGEAIRYFSKQDFSKLCSQAKAAEAEDLYLNLSKRYPVSWQALCKLACCSGKVCDYAKVQCNAPYTFEGWNTLSPCTDEDGDTAPLAGVCFDGYSPVLDPALLGILQQICTSPQNVFIIDSFKMLTRNAEKLLKVMEFLLSRDHRIVSSNFYIENGHVERRMKVLRAAHTMEEAENNLKQFYMLGPRHRDALKGALQ